MKRALDAALLVFAAVLTAGNVWAQPAQPAGALTLDQLRELRRAAAHQPRRIVANNDGCDCLYFPRNVELTVQSFLDQRTSGLIGSQVDTISYCTISSGFSFFTHDTKVGTLLTREPADYGLLPHTRNVARDLIDLGSDCLKSVVDFGHANGIEVFWSMRMNDTHDEVHTPERPYLLFPPLKEQHPEWLVGEMGKRTAVGRWSSVNYAVPEIRDLAFSYIEEVCRNYDVDGIELDFFRHLCYFASVANGGVASAEECGMMTDLLRRVREMTEQVGLQRGRPILVAVRVPDSVEFSREMGLDIERWLAEGLVDILITTCYFQLNPWEYTVELAHRYGAAAWPCLSDSRVQGETRFRRASLESYRGRAMNAWNAGADAIHTFNLFAASSPIFRQIGSPQTMAGLDKLYFATVRDGNPDSWLANGARHRNLPLLTPSHPERLSSGQPLELDLYVGEDFTLTDALPTVTLHLEMPGVKRPEQIQVALNDHTLEGAVLSDGWLDCPVQIPWLQRGRNRVHVALAASPTTTDEWSLQWEAPDHPQAPWFRDPGSQRTVEEPVDGALLLADRGTVAGDYLYYRYAWAAGPDEPVVVEAQVKVISGGSFVILTNGVAQERLGLWPDRIELYMHPDIKYAMDTTDDFHTYSIETDGPDLRVYVDGQLRLEAPGSFTSGAQGLRQLAFGAANSSMVGEALWKAVRARLSSLSCRDLVLRVDYP